MIDQLDYFIMRLNRKHLRRIIKEEVVSALREQESERLRVLPDAGDDAYDTDDSSLETIKAGMNEVYSSLMQPAYEALEEPRPSGVVQVSFSIEALTGEVLSSPAILVSGGDSDLRNIVTRALENTTFPPPPPSGEEVGPMKNDVGVLVQGHISFDRKGVRSGRDAAAPRRQRAETRL